MTDDERDELYREWSSRQVGLIFYAGFGVVGSFYGASLLLFGGEWVVRAFGLVFCIAGCGCGAVAARYAFWPRTFFVRASPTKVEWGDRQGKVHQVELHQVRRIEFSVDDYEWVTFELLDGTTRRANLGRAELSAMRGYLKNKFRGEMIDA